MISVIIGAYNAEKTIERAISSILNQTYTDYEIIICDDASTDKTLEILLNMYKNIKNMTVLINSVNCGLAYCLNKCLRLCKGEFVARMDCDDVSYPQRFDKQLNFLLRNKYIAFVGCGANFVWADKIFRKICYPEFPTVTDLCRRNTFIHPTVIFRKAELLSVNGYCIEKYALRCEDYDLFFRLYANKLYGANLPEILFNYTENPFDTSKHTLDSRINEYIVRKIGFKSLKAPNKYKCYIYLPLLLAIIPKKIYIKIKNKQLNRENL